MKKLVTTCIFLISVLLIVTISNANVNIEKVVPSTDGSVRFIISNLTLQEGESYQWAIEKSDTETITNWYEVTAPDYTKGEIAITVSSNNENQLAVLKSVDTAYLTIRKQAGEVLYKTQVDLSLPLLKAFNVTKNMWYGTAPTNPNFDIATVYEITPSNVTYKWEKITDPNIINSYIDNNHDLSGLELKGKESFPSLSDTSWRTVHYKSIYSTGSINQNECPQEDGLYYLWLQASDTDIKTVYGQAIIEIGTVQKITNSSSNGDSNAKQEESKTDTSTTNTGKTDSTTASGKLPKTGLGIILAISFAVILTGGVFALVQYRKLKGV